MAKAGKPSPLDRRPELMPEVAYVSLAFWDLVGARLHSETRIPPSEILAWMNLMSIPKSDRRRVYRYLREMDGLFLQIRKELRSGRDDQESH